MKRSGNCERVLEHSIYGIVSSLDCQTGLRGIKEGMGPSWKEIKHVQLVDSRQKEEDRKWDSEFQRRREELKEQRRNADAKRVRTSAKLLEMSTRWRSLEQRRTQKSEACLERLRTSLSLTLRNDSVTPSTFSER